MIIYRITLITNITNININDIHSTFQIFNSIFKFVNISSIMKINCTQNNIPATNKNYDNNLNTCFHININKH